MWCEHDIGQVVNLTGTPSPSLSLPFPPLVCVAAKIPTVVSMAMQDIKDGKSVVIGLLGTGEMQANRYFKSQGILPVAEMEEAKTEDAPASGRRGGRGPRVSYAVPDTDDDDYDSDDSDRPKKTTKKKPAPAKKKAGAPGGGGGGPKKRARANSSDDDDSDFDGDAGASGGGGGDDDDDDDDAAAGGGGLEEDDADETEFVGIQATLLTIIKKHVPDRGHGRYPDGTVFNYAERKKALMDKVKAQDLPQFPLDDLIHQLGGASQVAEITGRKCRVEFDKRGNPVQINRAKALKVAKKDVNIREMEAFQAGRKLIAIISEAGSTGISLHADRRAKNQRRRVHMTIEVRTWLVGGSARLGWFEYDCCTSVKFPPPAHLGSFSCALLLKRHQAIRLLPRACAFCCQRRSDIL